VRIAELGRGDSDVVEMPHGNLGYVREAVDGGETPTGRRMFGAEGDELLFGDQCEGGDVVFCDGRGERVGKKA
jgi:hypothetical protein